VGSQSSALNALTGGEKGTCSAPLAEIGLTAVKTIQLMIQQRIAATGINQSEWCLLNSLKSQPTVSFA